MPDSFGSMRSDVSIGDSKLKKYIKIILVLSSIVGILSTVLIFSIIFKLEFALKISFISIERLGVIAGISAFICGIYTLIDLIKGIKGV